ncbi:MAG: hypothetical protein GC164_10725 [Phycisphaera sp.]|nr:hypothetical protein [Phycisphaera sp.]
MTRKNLQLVRRLRGHVVKLWSDQTGTATMEFVLVFPIALFLALLIAQTTLVMAANNYVHYAAFAATRSAIVQIPDNSPSEPANYYFGQGSLKHEAIRRSAVYALVPVSGRLRDGDADPTVSPDAYKQGLDSYFATLGRTSPVWVESLMADRLRYADAMTTVRLYVPEVVDDNTIEFTDVNSGRLFGPRDPVTVRVTHKLNLSIPIASRFFADGSQTFGSTTVRYALVTADCTLTNEGIDRNLPPTPPVQRSP